MSKWVRPDLDTKFYIDFDWWEEKGRNFRIHLLSHLCDDCRERYKDYQESELIDWIDDETAEVAQVDGLWHALRICCSRNPDYINEQTPLTTAVFRTFLANGNEPLSATELQKHLRKPADVVLRTIGGFRVYNGVKPVVGRGRRSGIRPKKQTADE
jgi:hypothetical protein